MESFQRLPESAPVALLTSRAPAAVKQHVRLHAQTAGIS